MIFVLSSFLDNIAAALIGGAMAHQLFRAKVHIGYLAAIVAASNAGGAGSVIGDTTTTMMWIAGVSPLAVFEAYVAAAVALVIFGIPAAKQQHAHSPMIKHAHERVHVDWVRVGIVALILLCAIVANIALNLRFQNLAGVFPLIGAGVWVAILVSIPLRRPDWEVLPETFKGTMFLLSLVTAASMMPVETLPDASWQVALGLGFVSAVFDNIPLTALALKQGGYDWGFLAYAVGFGGSMIWFGSSAGVALSNQFPEAKSVGAWIRSGWHVAVAYVVGFFVLLAVLGWHPDLPLIGGRDGHQALVWSPRSRLAPLCAAAQDIVLYQGENFSGPRFSANDSVDDLARVGFNDRASSVTIRSGAWQLCSDSHYRGQCATLRAGDYPSLGAMGLGNAVSSIREIGWQGGGAGAWRRDRWPAARSCCSTRPG